MANLNALTLDFGLLPYESLNALTIGNIVLNSLTVAGFPYVETLSPGTVPQAEALVPNIWDDTLIWDDTDTWSDYQT